MNIGMLKKWALPVAFGSLALANFGYSGIVPGWLQGVAFGIAALSAFI